MLEYDIFADGIGNIVLEGGVMRLDLMTISPLERGKDGKPQMIFKKRVIMPIEGFLGTYSLMGKVIRQMEDAGVIQRKPESKIGASATDEQ